MSERRQAAWDEAQRRYPTGDRQAGFVAGAAWADDNPQHAPGVERADAHEEPEVHVVECRGGCARVFDKPRPDPLFVCRQCRLRMGQDV